MRNIKFKLLFTKIFLIVTSVSLLFLACANSSTDTSPSPRWTVTIVANGGRVSATSYTVTDGDSVDIPIPTRTGYAFVGWTVTNGGTSPNFTPNSTKVTANITIYAIWIKSYTVSFNTNGGTPATFSKQVNQGATLSLSAAELPKNSAKYITGIREYRDANNNLFEMGKTVVTSDLNLRVRWSVDLAILRTVLIPTSATNTATSWSYGLTGFADVWTFSKAPEISSFYYGNKNGSTTLIINRLATLVDNDRIDHDFIAKIDPPLGTTYNYIKALTDTSLSLTVLDSTGKEISSETLTKQ